jgi:hypothetical protein
VVVRNSMQVGGRDLLRRSLAGLCLALTAAAACSGTKSNGGADPPDGAAGDDSSAAGAGASSTAGRSNTGGSTGGSTTPSGGGGGAAAGSGSGSGSGGGAAAGSGAAAGKAGSGGHGGSGGAVVEPGPGTLGSPCGNLGGCKAGLTCLTPTSTELNNQGAPPHGLCTLGCESDGECAPHGAGALCVPFGDGATTGFCVEGCSFGEPRLGEQKCLNREDFACNPALLADTAEPCQTTPDCQSGELCIDGSCAIVFAGCLPSCRGDLDCAAGLYCDQSFLSGVCVAQKPVGKALGEPCTVPPANAPAEPDGCIGFCQADGDVGTQGHCSATCGLLNACGWNAQTQKYDGVCFYASTLTADDGYIGDFGFCTPTCNCSEECKHPSLSCSLLDQGPLTEDFRGPALCFTPDPSTEEYEACSTGGGSGEGGATNANAGGAGGAP